MSERREVPDFDCPACGEPSSFVVSAEQAFCTNTKTCRVIAFNPSLIYTEQDLASMHVIDFRIGE